MEQIDRPTMEILKEGQVLKVLDVKAKAEMKMPLHHSTKETVLVVLKGQAQLLMPDGVHSLEEGSVFIIPPKKEHSLSIDKDFHAIAIMDRSSEIEFLNP